MWVAQNSRSYPDLDEAVAVGVAALVGAMVLVALMVRFGMERFRALAVVSALLLVFWNWQSLALPIPGAPGWVSATLLACLLIWGAYLQGEQRLFRMVMLTVGITLVGVSSAIYVFTTSPTEPTHIVGSTGSPVVATLDRRPNIYILMLDGYARSDVLSGLYGFENEPFLRELTAGGFDVARSASSNYSLTHFSLASVFDANYLMEPGLSVSRADLDAVRTILAGDNITVSLLKNLGYEYIQGSEAWWGTECSSETDICLPNPFLGSTAYELLAGTPLRSFVYGEFGYLSAAVTSKRIIQIREWAEFSHGFGTSSPDFVFLHMPVPHPPLFMDKSCHPRLHEYAGGRILNQHPSITPDILEWRLQAYVEQIQCANLIASDLIDVVPEDAVVIVMSDHGSDSHGQLQRQPNSLEPEAIWERLSILAAVRLPSDCEDPIPDDLALINLMPIVINCVFGTDLPLREPRYFLAPNAGTAAPLFEVQDPNRVYSGVTN